MAARIEGELIAILFQSRASNRRWLANSIQPGIVRDFGAVNISSRRIVLFRIRVDFWTNWRSASWTDLNARVLA